mmetsp:Transcript_13125/g.16453  ORF Transcript_13125/g.16453 Transcript_13125/m.16453 type:complete len:242 (-) Transcript_13125:187-912(-)
MIDYSPLNAREPASSIWEIGFHSPSLFKDSVYKVTLLSPLVTAKMFPVDDQLTLQTTSFSLVNSVLSHSWFLFSLQMKTLPSWEQLAMVSYGRPMLGAQATSRTQPWCPSSTVGAHLPSLNVHILTVLSHPPVTNRLPESHHETELTPNLWAANFCSDQLFSLKDNTDTNVSEEAQARQSPCSCGAQAIEFTDKSCCSYVWEIDHPLSDSCQIITFRSYPQDAKMFPCFGCAQATCHTGPS